MANSTPVWHNIFRKIVLKPDNITFEAETYNDTINILRGAGVAWQGTSDSDTALATGNDTFMIDVDYDISIPVATTDLTLEDVNGNTSSVTFTAGRGIEIVRNSAQELEWRSYSVTETDTLQTVTERNNITNNKIFVNNIEVGTVSSSFTEDGFPSYDAGHNLIGDGTLDNPLQFSPEYQDSLMANNTDQFQFTALGPGNLAYSASYVFDTGATTGSVKIEREDPSSPGTWVILDNISGVSIGHSYAIQGIYSELYSGNVNYRLTYSWTGNLGVITWHLQNTFEGGAYTPINDPQIKTDTDAKTVNINDLQFFQNNIRTTISNTDIVLDPAGTGLVVTNSDMNVQGVTVGRGSGAISTNTVFGNSALFNNTSGANNVAIGYETLYQSATTNSNVAIGYKALRANTFIGQNTAVGAYALEKTTNGSNNLAVGLQAMGNNTDGYQNTAVGAQTMYFNTDGFHSTAVGFQALFWNNAGSFNTAVGMGSLTGSAYTQLSYNTALGAYSGSNLKTGTNNIIIGYNTQTLNNNDTNSIVIGYQAVGLGSNTTVIGNSSTTSTKLFGNVTANVVNAVYTTNSYANPSWITSLDASKIVGSIALSDITLDETIRIYDNVIETVVSNANLELRANGTGVVNITDGLTVLGNVSAILVNSSIGLGASTGTGITTINSGALGSLDNITIGGTTAAAGTFTQVTRSGAVSAANWGTTGVGIRSAANIYTDTSTPLNTTAAAAHINVLSQPTIATSGTNVTITDAATLYIANAPANGTNATITNKHALYVAAGTTTLLGNLTASGSNAAIVMSPTGASGTITMNPAGGGSLDNFNLGSTTAGSGRFTSVTAVGATNTAAIITPTTALSSTAWTTTGINLRSQARTYTDTSSAAGTVAASYIHALAQPSFASTNAITITNAANLFVNTVGAGTNTTITNSWAIWANGKVYATDFTGTIGGSSANSGSFTTLSATSTVSGTGFSTYLASPPAIGGTAAAAGAFTTLTTSTAIAATDNSTQAATTAFVKSRGGFTTTVVISSTQAWTIPTGITKAMFIVIGGGGTGGGTTSNTGGGGGSGGVAVKFLTGLTPGNTINVTVNGAANTTTLTSGTQAISTITANQGANGSNGAYTAGAISAPGAGGSASGGDINLTGGSGTRGLSTATTAAAAYSGNGGNTPLGYGFGGIGAAGSTTTAIAATGYGSGGGGGNNAAGAAGLAGAVIIEY